MKRLSNQQKEYFLFGLILALLLPALSINIGLLAFIDDESIRSLVAMEMYLSGNYITPTIHGEYYYLKPPLYNWLLLIFFNISGTFNEYTARFATVVFLLLFAATIFHYSRKHFTIRQSFLNAIIFITCGRVLFWDSFLGLIDMCFSWLMFSLFMVIYHQYEKEQYYKLFFFSYLLAAAGFLMKGLPAIVFLGITLLTFFIYRKKFWKLFSLPHILAGFTFLGIIASYYLIYNQYNGLENIFYSLFNESTKRTAVHFGIWEAILHFFTFPFEMIYHFLPWALFVIFFIRKDILKQIRSNDFITYLLLIFLTNIFPYWTSPEVYPRYLLMLAPLIFTTYVFWLPIHEKERSWQFHFFDKLFLAAILVAAIGSFLPYFLERAYPIPYLYLKLIVIHVLMIGLCALYILWKPQRTLIFAAALLVIRLGFDWFVLPDREANDFGSISRADSIRIGEKYKDRELYLYKKNVRLTFNAFYISGEREEILKYKDGKAKPGALYLIDPAIHKNVPYSNALDSLRIRYERRTLLLVELETPNDQE